MFCTDGTALCIWQKAATLAAMTRGHSQWHTYAEPPLNTGHLQSWCTLKGGIYTLFFSDTSQTMFPFTLSPTLDHTKFNIWEDKCSLKSKRQGWAVIDEFSSSKEGLPASLWGTGPERPTVVCLSFHQAWCLLAAATLSQNPTAQLSYKHCTLLLRAACLALLLGAENMLFESCSLHVN